MPNLNAFAAELPKPRNLLPERLGDRANHRDRLDFGKRRPSFGHHICRHSELVLTFQHETVLFLDFGASHELIPTAS
jgi:hypothetical protein